jgi:hypothetical protein
MRPAVAELYDDEERIALFIDHENLVIDARGVGLDFDVALHSSNAVRLSGASAQPCHASC